MRKIHIRLWEVLWTCYGRQKYRWFVGEKNDGFPKQDKQSSVFCLAQSILSQPLVLKCCNLLLPSFAIIGASEPDNWHCLWISKVSVGHIIRYAGYLKMCARTVPRSFTVEYQTESRTTSSVLLARFEADGEAFWSRIVTIDGTWVHNFKHETKGQSV